MSSNVTFSKSSTASELIGSSRTGQASYMTQFVRTGAPLVLMDVVGYLVSLLIASTIALYFGAAPTAPSLVMSLALIVGSLAMFAALGLYSGMGMHPIFEFRQCMLGVCLSFVFIAGVSIQTGNAMAILFSFPIMLAVVPVVRSTTRHIFAKRSWWGINCVVLACD